MLYLTRKIGEAVIINHDIEVRVVEMRGKTVKLGFVFPAHASVLREEIFVEVMAANQAAVADTEADLSLTGLVPETTAAEDDR